jgi:tetratricopeptide (TPR) repeat protein
MTLLPEFSERLTSALRSRRMNEGLKLLASVEDEIASIQPQTPGAAELLLLLAQWIDVGYRDHHYLEALLRKFPQACRKLLCVDDYLRLRMAEGFHELAAGELDLAIFTLDLVLRTCRDLNDASLEALAHFWKGRAHRKKGEYGASLEHIVQARTLAQDRGDDIFAAVVQIHESWLLFQKGLSKEATRLLDCAESVLGSTDHFIALGNVESARGRIVRRAGEYTRSLEHFSRALELYSRRDPKHVNVARTLVNAAYVRRVLALQLRRRIDAKAGQGSPRANAVRHASGETLLTRYDRIWHDAVECLQQAFEIYTQHAYFDGIGKVLLNLGFLYLDRGDIQLALKQASEAHEIGLRQDDHILMARVRILETAIENAQVEEQIDGDVDVGSHANLALQYCEQALTLARSTQNRRLLAGACIARGTTAANEFFQDWETARRYAGEATALLDPGDSDLLVEDLRDLKSRIVRASEINDTLRCWSEGIVGHKTFQQITEEFAEIVIPKVWLRENRKVSRVASSLSVSPKKVRRILRNSGVAKPEDLPRPGT